MKFNVFPSGFMKFNVIPSGLKNLMFSRLDKFMKLNVLQSG